MVTVSPFERDGEKQHENSTKLQVDLPSGGGAEPSDIFDVVLFPFGP